MIATLSSVRMAKIAVCATRSGTLAKALSTSSAMDTTRELSLFAAGHAAAPHVPAGHPPAPQALGVHSLRELVRQAVMEAEAQAIRRALASTKGNKSLAARVLQTHYTTLHAKMKRFGISAREFLPN